MNSQYGTEEYLMEQIVEFNKLVGNKSFWTNLETAQRVASTLIKVSLDTAIKSDSIIQLIKGSLLNFNWRYNYISSHPMPMKGR